MNVEGKIANEIAGFLDEGTGMAGELYFVGRLRLDGEFHGSISTEGTLVVGEHASVRGDIKVSVIEIAGKIFGNIEAKRRVEILGTGRVQGDVQTPVLVMKPGSKLDGRSSMEPLIPQ